MSNCALLFSDDGRRVLDVSGASELLGQTRESLEPRAMPVWLHPRDRALWKPALRRLRQGGKKTMRLKLRWRNAASGWTTCSTVLRRVPGGVQARLTAVADRGLVQLRQTIERLPEPLLVFAAEGLQLRYANQRARRLFPGAGASGAARTLYEILPLGAERLARAVQECRTLHRAAFELELEGQPHNVELLQLEGADNVAGTFLVRLGAAALTDSPGRAARLAELGGMAGMLAHDFNNLATVIVSYSDQLLAEGPAETREAAGEIADAARSATALCQRVLALSRGEPQAQSLLDLNRVLRKMSNLLRRMMSREIVLQIRLGDAPLMVQADIGELEQIILNLALNARDAMPQGGRLEVTARRRPEARGKAAAEAFAELTVRDTGQGIDSALHERIFEPFFTTKGQRGTGLGLATVRKLVLQCGGVVEVESRPGEGAAFRVLLPLAPVAESSPRVLTAPTK